MAVGLKFAVLPLILIIFISILPAESEVIDVIKDFGAKIDGKSDLSPPLLNAFKKACEAADASKIIIPKGDYMLSEITMEGPCKAPLEIMVDGTIKAPENVPSNGKDPHWFEIFQHNHLTISGSGVFDGSGTNIWGKACAVGTYCSKVPINLRISFVNNSVIRDITTKDSKQFHTTLLGCDNITFENYHVSAPATSLNTDGIHIGRSSNVKILNSEIKTGDDCISIGDGTTNLTIDGVSCGPGHGISIGSLGKFPHEMPVTGIEIKNCTFDNSDNGMRVKTWPDSISMKATVIKYQDITLNNVTNPIIIDQQYCPYSQCDKSAGSNVQLSEISFKNVKGTAATPAAVQLICSKTLPCIDVVLDNVDVQYNGPGGPAKCEAINVQPKISALKSPASCSANAITPTPP